MAKVEVKVRQARADDFPHIYTSWLAAYQNEGFARGVRPSVYRDRQNRLIRDIIENRDTTHILVACPPDDDLTILAWAVYEVPNTVHFVFTKPAFRRLGLAAELLKAVTNDFLFTHRTVDFDRFSRAMKYRAAYDPYSAFPRRSM